VIWVAGVQSGARNFLMIRPWGGPHKKPGGKEKRESNPDENSLQSSHRTFSLHQFIVYTSSAMVAALSAPVCFKPAMGQQRPTQASRAKVVVRAASDNKIVQVGHDGWFEGPGGAPNAPLRGDLRFREHNGPPASPPAAQSPLFLLYRMHL
jgi:hypothetical protein